MALKLVNENQLRFYFIKLLISENQAIGIYQAEIFIKSHPKHIFLDILKEEVIHKQELKKCINLTGWNLSVIQVSLLRLNRIIGWLIGLLLSMAPRKLCFYFHRLGEIKAAEEYEALRDLIERCNNPDLINSINKIFKINTIIKCENMHAEIFNNLSKSQ
jgi:hypothetical protein